MLEQCSFFVENKLTENVWLKTVKVQQATIHEQVPSSKKRPPLILKRPAQKSKNQISAQDAYSNKYGSS